MQRTIAHGMNQKQVQVKLVFEDLLSWEPTWKFSISGFICIKF